MEPSASVESIDVFKSPLSHLSPSLSITLCPIYIYLSFSLPPLPPLPPPYSFDFSSSRQTSKPPALVDAECKAADIATPLESTPRAANEHGCRPHPPTSRPSSAYSVTELRVDFLSSYKEQCELPRTLLQCISVVNN